MRSFWALPVLLKMRPQKIDPERSAIMRAVRSKNTTPELKVRSFLHRLGFRYRLYRSDLPGVPDLVFPRLKKVIFVHGCFWHGHSCARGNRVPKTRTPYWQQKISQNRERDERHLMELQNQGWSALTVWECDLAKNFDPTAKAILKFLRPNKTRQRSGS